MRKSVRLNAPQSMLRASSRCPQEIRSTTVKSHHKLVIYSRPNNGTETLLKEQPSLLMNREELRFELLCTLLIYFQDTDQKQAEGAQMPPSLHFFSDARPL